MHINDFVQPKDMNQIELPLEWRVLKVDKCKHENLRYGGLHLGEIPIVTCYASNKPYCGGTFDARTFKDNCKEYFQGDGYREATQ